jgi:MFS family permease
MGIYSTSQFLGVAIGGALGGWVDGFFDSQTVFLLGALLAMLWLLVAGTMSEPPYVSSLRVEIPDGWWRQRAAGASAEHRRGSNRRWWCPTNVGVYQNRQQGDQPLRN